MHQLARSNQCKERQLTRSVNQGNVLLQDPARAQSLQGFKTKGIISWKQSLSGATKHKEIAELELFKARRAAGVPVAYACPDSVYFPPTLALLSVKLLTREV